MFIRRKPLGGKNFQRPGSLGLNLLRGNISRIQSLTIRRRPLFTAAATTPLSIEESPAAPLTASSIEQPFDQVEQSDQFAPADYGADFDVEEAEFVEDSPQEYTPPARQSQPSAASRPPAAASAPVQRKIAAPQQPPAASPKPAVKPAVNAPSVSRAPAPSPVSTPKPAAKSSAAAPGPDMFPAVPRGEIPSDLSKIFNMHKEKGFADHLRLPENLPETPKVDPAAMARDVQRSPAESPEYSEPSDSFETSAPAEPSIPAPTPEPVRVRGRRRSKVMEIIPESTRASMEAEDARKAKIASQYLGDQAGSRFSTPSGASQPVQRTSEESEPAYAEESAVDSEIDDAPSYSEAILHTDVGADSSASPVARSVQRHVAEPIEADNTLDDVDDIAVDDIDSTESMADTLTPSKPTVARTSAPVPTEQRTSSRQPAPIAPDEFEPADDDQFSEDPSEASAPTSRSLPAVQRSTIRPSSIQRTPEPELTSGGDEELLDYSDDDFGSSMADQPVDLYQAMVNSGLVRPEPEAPPAAESGEPESIPTTIMPPIGRPGQRNKHLSPATPNTVAAKRDDTAPQLTAGPSASSSVAPSAPSFNPPSDANYMQNMQTMMDFPTVQRSSSDEPADFGASDTGDFAASEESDESASSDDDSSRVDTRRSTPPAQAVQRSPDRTPTKPRMPVSSNTSNAGDSGPESTTVDFGATDTFEGGFEAQSSAETPQHSVQRFPVQSSDDFEEAGTEYSSDEGGVIDSPATHQHIQRTPTDIDSPAPNRQRVQRHVDAQPSVQIPNRETGDSEAFQGNFDVDSSTSVDTMDTSTEAYTSAEAYSGPPQSHASRPGQSVRRSVQRTPAPQDEMPDVLDADEFGLIGDTSDIDMSGDAESPVVEPPSKSSYGKVSRQSVQRTPSVEPDDSSSDSAAENVEAFDSVQTDLLKMLNLPANTPVYRGPTSGPATPGPSPKAQRMPAEPPKAVQRMIADDIGQNTIQRAETASEPSPAPAQPSNDQASPGDDKAAVEKMAQEVYRLLRQRLKVERERFNKR